MFLDHEADHVIVVLEDHARLREADIADIESRMTKSFFVQSVLFSGHVCHERL